ncbi:MULTISPECIES: LuxR C-terminal-related transcriptional regulator [Protofrankia]|uniref:Uncharacterized protein n=1 Tax=Candidatus Protofrankia datiscae TaxID=2716812 RepID=F8B4A8_9ACTN|nr:MULTISPECIES: LuxR C-terminal-related transcriptional regulator [Protofrankia]AEH09382.1 hypothetical protein FsymDg_1948 [Candidatus Protofrankia datiscae]
MAADGVAVGRVAAGSDGGNGLGPPPHTGPWTGRHAHCPPRLPGTSLIGRECEIAYVAGTGRKNKEIADEPNPSPRTVQLRLARIHRMLAGPLPGGAGPADVAGGVTAVQNFRHE